ncbi:MAG: type II toxin-antitoxin system HicA family toxin [Candidatus Woesearchaeota archaeon]
MPKLPQISGNELCKIIEKYGFIHTHTTGSHKILKHDDGRRTTIPCHANEQIGPGLLNKIIKKDLGISREEFLSMYKK